MLLLFWYVWLWQNSASSVISIRRRPRWGSPASQESRAVDSREETGFLGAIRDVFPARKPFTKSFFSSRIHKYIVSVWLFGKCSLSVPVFSFKQVCMFIYTLSQCLAVCLCYRCLRLGGCQGVYDLLLHVGTSWPPTASPALGWELSPIGLHQLLLHTKHPAGALSEVTWKNSLCFVKGKDGLNTGIQTCSNLLSSLLLRHCASRSLASLCILCV